jgi:hypothetical protein
MASIASCRFFQFRAISITSIRTCQLLKCYNNNHSTNPAIVACRAVPGETARDVRDRCRRRTPRAAASMSLLRRSHDHHRDLRARLPAQTPPGVRYSSDRDRHLMMPPPPIQQPSDARHSGWLGQHSRRLLQVDKSARNDTANPVRQPSLRSFSASPTPTLRGKAVGAGALTNLAQPDAAAKSP